MKLFSMFSGIGGFDLAFERVFSKGNIVGFSEIDEKATAIYRHHFKGVRNYGNIAEIDERQLPDFDVCTFGFPCQDVSVAGERRGFRGERSSLFYEAMRIIRYKRPKYILFENVKGLFSSNGGKDFTAILKEIAESGFDAQWQLLNSKHFGVPQNRERVYLVGHLRGECFPEIFPIGESGGIHQEAEADGEAKGEWFWGGHCVSAITRDYHKGVHCGGETYIQEKRVVLPDEYIFEDWDTDKEYPICPFCLEDFGECDCLGITSEFEDGRYRRLTPRECERLQGFPDDWTLYGLDIHEKLITIPDTHRYKGLGNAITVNVAEEIFRRLNASQF